MSSSSDSEDDEAMKQFLEATDTSLLNNALFMEKSSSSETNGSASQSTSSSVCIASKKDEPKSQRYLDDTDVNIGMDILLPETVREHFSKKFSHILEQQIEFSYHIPESSSKKKQKNRVKLLVGADCYVKPYEEFEYEFKGPGKKPDIKRRKLSEELSEQEKLTSTAVNPKDIFSGCEVKNWAKKPDKPNKMFYYKKASNSNVLNAKEKITEFTKMRQKNKWNESKIKKT